MLPDSVLLLLFADRQKGTVEQSCTKKQVIRERVFTTSAAESQNTQSNKDLSGNLIMMDDAIDTFIFGIHTRSRQQMTFGSNLPAAVSDSQFAKSKSV